MPCVPRSIICRTRLLSLESEIKRLSPSIPIRANSTKCSRTLPTTPDVTRRRLSFTPGDQIQPRLWSAHLSLGNALLRTGQAEEGRKEVEESFQGDPFNLWAKNTLDLLDTMKEYRETKRGSIRPQNGAQRDGCHLLYAGDLLEEVSTKLSGKVQFHAEEPDLGRILPRSLWISLFARWAARTRRPRGLFWSGHRSGFTGGSSERRVQLGKHVLARIYPRRLAPDYRSSDPDGSPKGFRFMRNDDHVPAGGTTGTSGICGHTRKAGGLRFRNSMAVSCAEATGRYPARVFRGFADL